MKKLLLLGGSRFLLPVIETAHRLGYAAVTCDNLPDNIAHRYSDAYYNVSIIDKDAVLALAQELKIDGIMSFACDPGVVTAAYVAEIMGLPTCGSYESVTILQNKVLFRTFLEKNGFNVPKARGYGCLNDVLEDVDYYQWPVIVKPVDSAGSKGVTKVDSPAELADAVALALKYSFTNRIIVEEYIEKVGYTTGSDSFSIDGKLVYASFDDQHFNEGSFSPFAPTAHTWPSSMPQWAQDELRSELQRLLTLLGMKTSLYNIEARLAPNGKVYIMEVSPRAGGNRLSEVLTMATNVDLVTNAVRAAVGEPVVGIDSDPKYNGHWAILVLHSKKDGVFDSLWIDEEFRKRFVVETKLDVFSGNKVFSFRMANQTIGSAILRFETAQQLNHYMENLDQYIKVLVK